MTPTPEQREEWDRIARQHEALSVQWATIGDQQRRLSRAWLRLTLLSTVVFLVGLWNVWNLFG